MPKKKKPSVSDVLKEMRRLLKAGWTQHVAARSAANREVDVASPRATQFCLYGAALRASRDLNAPIAVHDRVDRLVRQCVKAVHSSTAVADFNDTKGRTVTEILRVVSCATKKAQARQRR